MLDSYKRNGYFIGRQTVDRERVIDILEEMRALAIHQLKYLGATLYFLEADVVFGRLLEIDRTRYIATLSLCAKLKSLYSLYASANICNAAFKDCGIRFPVFQTQPAMHVMSDELHISGGYFGFEPHQDWPTMQGPLNAVTVWIPFTEVGPDNFTMDVIPGSHLRGLLPFKRTEHTFSVEAKEEDFVPIIASPGDVVFMSAFTVHRSSRNGSGFRVSTSMRYEDASDPTFIERVYPFGHKRVVWRELITPDFPSREQVNKVFA